MQHASHCVDFVLQGVAVHHGKLVVMIVAVLRLIGMIVNQPVRPHVAAMVDRRMQQHAQAPPLQGRHGDDRHAQHFRQAVQVDFHSPLFHDIHHVQGNDNRLAQFQKLQRQIQIPLQRRRVYDVDDDVDLVA